MDEILFRFFLPDRIRIGPKRTQFPPIPTIPVYSHLGIVPKGRALKSNQSARMAWYVQIQDIPSLK